MANRENVFGRFFLVASNARDALTADDGISGMVPFSIDGICVYSGYHNDFGPMNLGTIFKFCALVDKMLNDHPDRSIALATQSDEKTLTNAVFLVGAYMIIRLDYKPFEVQSRFEYLQEELTAFRDVSPGPQNFDLMLRDCWDGLWKGKTLNWVRSGKNGFDLQGYEHFGCALNGCVHEIIPGKFLALRGPKSLQTDKNWDDTFDKEGRFICRDFTPEYYIHVLHHFKVQVLTLKHFSYTYAKILNQISRQLCDSTLPNTTGRLSQLRAYQWLSWHSKIAPSRRRTLWANFLS